jgi:flavin-binding protein dodecin
VTRVALWISSSAPAALDADEVRAFLPARDKEEAMSVYKVIEIIGSSKKSWADAAQEAMAQARTSLRDLRVAEVVKMDLALTDDGQIEAFRVKLSVSFKYEQG